MVPRLLSLSFVVPTGYSFNSWTARRAVPEHRSYPLPSCTALICRCGRKLCWC